MGGSSKATSAKRSAPSADHTSQPETKKQMPMQMNQSNTQGLDMQTIDANQMRPSIMQCAMRATPPCNPNLTLEQNAEIMNSALGYQNYSTGAEILGAAPPHTQSFNQKRVLSSRKKVKRWDVPAQGMTTYTPGAATWKRNAQMTQIQENFPVRMEGIAPASPCKSDANSAAAGSFVHDSWPIHTPANSFSHGTQDSRQGVFSPPQMTREAYGAPNYYVSIPQGGELRCSGIQMEERQRTETQISFSQTQDPQNNEVTAEKAEALAFKAPQAP